MPERHLYREFRAQNRTTKYPFSAHASLLSSDNRVLLEGVLVDASLYPVGAGSGLYLSRVVLDHQTITLFIGDTRTKLLASGSVDLLTPDNVITLVDTLGRPAGALVSENDRMAVFQSWGIGTHDFLPAASPFVASVCIPTPEIGVRGIGLEDGTVLTGDVWLVGSDGVVLRTEDVVLPATRTQAARLVNAIRIDVVGDPLFRRRLCSPRDLFATPRFIQTLRVRDAYQTVDITPDATGNVQLSANNQLASDSALRLTNTPAGIKIGAMGTLQTGNA